jgi:hypothetical protein
MKWLIVRMGSSFLWAGPQNRMCAIRGNTCPAADTVASSEGIRAGLWHTSLSLRRSATAVVVPQLRGDKYVLPLNCPCLDHLLHGVADHLFIAVAFRTVEVSKSYFQCGLGCLFRGEGIGDQRAKSEAGIAPDPSARGIRV